MVWEVTLVRLFRVVRLVRVVWVVKLVRVFWVERLVRVVRVIRMVKVVRVVWMVRIFFKNFKKHQKSANFFYKFSKKSQNFQKDSKYLSKWSKIVKILISCQDWVKKQKVLPKEKKFTQYLLSLPF